MKKKLGVVLLIFGFICSIYVAYRLYHSTRLKMMLMESEMTERFYEPVLGVYDRDNAIPQSKAKNIKHFALILNGGENWEVDNNLLENIHDTIPILLTIEMYDINGLEKTAKGENDENIKNLLSELIANRENIYIRWNPEMEVPANIYPWNNQPLVYIEAFKTFSGICKEIAPRAQIIYGPAGYAGALESYPGDDVVNAASITLDSNAEINSSLYNASPIPEQIKRKLHRMRFISKPIFILGSKNMEVQSFNNKWILDAINNIEENEDVVYTDMNFSRSSKNWREYEEDFKIGVFDPNLLLVKEQAVAVEHLFFDFAQIESGSFLPDLNNVFSRDHDAIVSIEPTYWDKAKDSAILKRIVASEFDSIFTKFYSSLPKTDKIIYLRFAHEMEIPITRYAWQSKDPIDYIKAFRYFMNFPDAKLENVEKVWGPAGDRGSLEYWPGNDVVDYMSIAIYGLTDKNITDPNQQESFAQAFYRKSWRLRFVDKPIFITEFGVKGEEAYQTNWLKGAAETLNGNYQVVGVSYFNRIDVPKAWGEIEPPNWSISKDTYFQFLETLERD